MKTVVPEINGKPAAYIAVSAEEKINIGNFSNVTVAASVARYVEDDPDVIDQELRATIRGHCEDLVAEERGRVLEELKESKT